MLRHMLHRLLSVIVPLACALAVTPHAAAATPWQTASTTQPASEWPQSTSVGGVTYTLNQPGYLGISGNMVTLRSALQVEAQDGTASVGTATMTAAMSPSDVNGLVELNNFNVSQVDGITGSGVAGTLTSLLANMAFTVPLATVVQDITISETRSDKGLSNAAPAIVVTNTPTVLVSVAGQPILRTIGITGWQRVSNTPFVLLRAENDAWWVKLGESTWMTATSMTGPFTASAYPPPQDVINGLGQMPQPPAGLADPSGATPARAAQPPAVIVATSPTTLVSINGAMQLAPAGPGLQIVTNTQQTMLVREQSPTYWVLASGRWFSSDATGGPWTFVPAGKLPPEFAQLKSDGGKISSVMASVPGTNAAKEAVVNSSLVRTVVLNRASAQCDVKFAGTPTFAPIQGTAMQYATNASQPVIEIGGAVYCCDNAAWFKAASANGPWTLCDQVPEAIYGIPASCPVYACTFVEVYGSSADSVTFGYTAGYLGTYIQDGAAVYGTGYSYGSAVASDGTTQNYPQTWGSAANYDQDTGTYAPVAADDGAAWGCAGYWPAVYPEAYYGGYPGWGWYGGYDVACAWGYGRWGTYHNWSNWYDHWHPNYNGWRNGMHDWSQAAANRWSGTNAIANRAGFDNGNLARADMWGGMRQGGLQNGAAWNRAGAVGDVNRPLDAGADRGGWNQAWRRPTNGQASGFHSANQRFDQPGARTNANAGYRGGNYRSSGENRGGEYRGGGENRGGAPAGGARGGGGGGRR